MRKAMLVLLLCIGVNAHASTVYRYSYTSQPFEIFSPGMLAEVTGFSGWLTLATPLLARTPGLLTYQTVTPIEFMITDGLTTVTQDSPAAPDQQIGYSPSFSFITDYAGEIVDWSVRLIWLGFEFVPYQHFSFFLIGGQEATAYCAPAAGSAPVCASYVYAQHNFFDGSGSSWTSTVVPAPPAVYLLGTALLFLMRPKRS